jgi:resuscitation-promoting factor RpfB
VIWQGPGGAAQRFSRPGETSASGPSTLRPPQSPSPTIEKQTITETQEIPFKERTVNDSSLAKGTREVRTKGVTGVKTLTYEVTLTNGVETSRELLGEEITQKPVTQVIAIGTKEEPQEEPSCDPNYSGACVPIASDVDCAGGSGNGPAYVQGPVTVIGSDIYDLDRDGDGIGCEAN